MPPASPEHAFLTQYCIGCHNERAKVGGLALDTLDVSRVGTHPETWEKVVRKIKTGMMPPSGVRRPERSVLDGFAGEIASRLDRVTSLSSRSGRRRRSPSLIVHGSYLLMAIHRDNSRTPHSCTTRETDGLENAPTSFAERVLTRQDYALQSHQLSLDSARHMILYIRPRLVQRLRGPHP